MKDNLVFKAHGDSCIHLGQLPPHFIIQRPLITTQHLFILILFEHSCSYIISLWLGHDEYGNEVSRKCITVAKIRSNVA